MRGGIDAQHLKPDSSLTLAHSPMKTRTHSFAGTLVPLLAALLLVPPTPASAQQPGVQKIPVDPLVEPGWLMDNIDDPTVVVLHPGERGLADGRIPGTRVVGLDGIAWEGGQGWQVEFRDVEQLIETFRGAGVNSDSKVVIYGPSMTMAARVWVTFDFLGLGDHAFVLNGGYGGWVDAGGAVETGELASVTRGNVSAENPIDFRVSAEWIAGNLEDESVALLDARPDDEYTGADGGMGGMARPGHIPGAAQLYWEELMVEGSRLRFRDRAEIEDVLRRHGAGPDKTNVSYCMIGLRASVDYLATRMLGWDARFYDGSWHDWGTRDDVPVATGADVRR